MTPPKPIVPWYPPSARWRQIWAALLTLIADLVGPRYRIGAISGRDIALETGQTLRLDQDETPGDQTRIPLPHAEVYGAAKIGDLLRLDDGRVVLRITSVSAFALTCTVVAGAELSSHKIISLPSSPPKRGNYPIETWPKLPGPKMQALIGSARPGQGLAPYGPKFARRLAIWACWQKWKAARP